MGRVYLEHQGDGVELPWGVTIIGRDVTCTLRFNDPSISRRHLRVVRRLDQVYAEDLGSTNGTLLNGRRLVAPAAVDNGDRLEVGDRTLVVRVVPDAGLLPSGLLQAEAAVPTEVAQHRRSATVRMPVTVPPPASGVARAMMRRYDRSEIELQLVYVSAELEIEATTRDVSIGGLFVRTHVLDPVGTECELTMLIDGGPPLRLRGVVRRVVEHDAAGLEPIGMGVEFRDLRGLEQAWLEKMIAKLAEE